MLRTFVSVRLAPTLIAASLSGACSNTQEPYRAAAGASADISTHELFTSMQNDFVAQSKTITQLEAMPIATIFDAIRAMASDEPVTVGAATINGTKSFMTAIRSQYLASMSSYQTLGDFLVSSKIDLSAVTEADLEASLQTLPSIVSQRVATAPSASLGLLDDLAETIPPPSEDVSRTTIQGSTKTITGVKASNTTCKAFDGLMTAGYWGVTMAGVATLDHPIAKYAKYAAIGLGALGGTNYGLNWLFCHEYAD